jgi:6-phosphogluconolactonase
MQMVESYPDVESVAQAAAEQVAAELRGGAVTLVLAGGSTPRNCYLKLAAMPIEWGRVTVLFGDERCVEPQHSDSNYLMAREALLDQVAPASVHRIPAELGPEAGAELYDHVVGSLQPLDLVLLGIGPDGHTASLFPGHPALEAGGWAAAVRDAPKPPPERVTLSLHALTSARRVLFLVTGEDKAQAVARARRAEVPAGMIPHAEWILDQAAASRL